MTRIEHLLALLLLNMGNATKWTYDKRIRTFASMGFDKVEIAKILVLPVEEVAEKIASFRHIPIRRTRRVV